MLTAKKALFGFYVDSVSKEKISIINHLILITKLFRGAGWGDEGKQVESMDEEPQVRGCYLYTNQPGNSVC